MGSGISEAIASGVQFVRLTWTDNANVIRAKAIHTSVLADVAPQGVGITVAQQALPVMADAVVPDSGLGPIGEARLMPDWTTLTTLAYAPSHARVMADVTLDDKPWALCPRTFLRRMTAEAARDGFEVMAAFENEFYLLRSRADGGIAPADDTVFASTRAMDALQPFIDDFAESLIAQRIPVELYYPESGSGQHELSTKYTNAVEAADRQVVFRETAHAIASRHGLKASFLPKVFENQAGSGCHLHLSLWKDGHNVFPDPDGAAGLSPVGRSFVAGILEHLPALVAMVAPTPNSYRRLRPQTWSGAFRCWGLDNREAAIRVPGGPSGKGSSHFEIKTVDASSNPYLALGAAIAAGMDGIRRKRDPGPPLQVDPGTLSEEELTNRGIEPLPTSLKESLACLEADRTLLDALGPGLVKSYVAVRRAEDAALGNVTLEEEVRMLLERY